MKINSGSNGYNSLKTLTNVIDVNKNDINMPLIDIRNSFVFGFKVGNTFTLYTTNGHILVKVENISLPILTDDEFVCFRLAKRLKTLFILDPVLGVDDYTKDYLYSIMKSIDSLLDSEPSDSMDLNPMVDKSLAQISRRLLDDTENLTIDYYQRIMKDGSFDIAGKSGKMILLTHGLDSTINGIIMTSII